MGCILTQGTECTCLDRCIRLLGPADQTRSGQPAAMHASQVQGMNRDTRLQIAGWNPRTLRLHRSPRNILPRSRHPQMLCRALTRTVSREGRRLSAQSVLPAPRCPAAPAALSPGLRRSARTRAQTHRRLGTAVHPGHPPWHSRVRQLLGSRPNQRQGRPDARPRVDRRW